MENEETSRDDYDYEFNFQQNNQGTASNRYLGHLKPRLTKVCKLKAALNRVQQIEANRKKLGEDSRQKLELQDLLESALKRARGEKVLDNISKIKRSLLNKTKQRRKKKPSTDHSTTNTNVKPSEEQATKDRKTKRRRNFQLAKSAKKARRTSASRVS